MDPIVKNAVQTLVITALYLTLFVVLMPLLLRFLDKIPGQIAYGLLAAGAAFLALRLRRISRRL